MNKDDTTIKVILLPTQREAFEKWLTTQRLALSEPMFRDSDGLPTHLIGSPDFEAREAAWRAGE